MKDIFTTMNKRSTGYNRRLAKVAAQCSADTFVVNQSLVLRTNICGENRHLRQAPKRCVQAEKMNDIFENDRKFKEAIGAFIIAFSELEFGLAILCTLTEFNPRHKDKFLSKYIGYSFEQKRNTLNDFIKKELPEIENIWSKINADIGQINRERRFIAHGFMTYSLPNENISTYIREKGKIVEQKQSIEKIKDLTKSLHEINTGRNGVNGEFHTQFTKMRIDKWNELVIEKYRIIYKVNNEIISQWKG